MCGFVGIFDVDGKGVDPEVLKAMRVSCRHRGPDDSGRVLFSMQARPGLVELSCGSHALEAPMQGGLGFNRLSILDLSERGHQPMVDERGEIIIVFNGEIYNAFEIRPHLEAKGYRFKSNTDTEVILNLYREYGQEGMLEQLNGMFAICIVDLTRKRVTLARDRLGIKPLYYAWVGRTLLFASEAKAFLSYPGFEMGVSETCLDEFLLFRYCAQDRHLMANTWQVEAGQWLEIRAGERRVHQHRYWCIPDMHREQAVADDEAVQMLSQHLDASVKRRLLSDVKLGCQLSGGIDSSLINLSAARHVSGNLDAFSVIFDDPAYSEEIWIDEAAKCAQVKSHKYTLNEGYFGENVAKATWHLDQPLNHPNSLGLMFLAEHASRHVTVLLSGEGADELWGGYQRFFYAMARPWVRPAIPLLSRTPRLGARLRRRFGERDAVDQGVLASAFLNPALLSGLRPEARLDRAMDQRRALFEAGRSGSFIANSLKYEMQTYLVDLLIRQDKMTMAFSLENRVPFLDHTWVEFMRTHLAPSNLVRLRLGRGVQQTLARSTKVVLKELARRSFGDAFVDRSKQGFAIPLKSFFSGGLMRDRMESAILPGIAKRGLLSGLAVKGLWQRLDQRSETELEALWVAFALEEWCQGFEAAAISVPGCSARNG